MIYPCICIQDAKFVSQLLCDRASEMQTVIPYKTTKINVKNILSALSLLHFHRVQIHSANEALFMFWVVQTDMVIALLLLSRLFLPTVSFMLA